MNIQNNASGRAISRDRQQRGTVGKTNDLVAARRQDDGQGFADGWVVIDDEDFTARGWLFGHVTPSFVAQKTTQTPRREPASQITTPVFLRDDNLTHK